MEITMRAFKGTFKKKNGESRNMVFAKISDLPQSFLSTTVLGAGSEQSYPECPSVCGCRAELIFSLIPDARASPFQNSAD